MLKSITYDDTLYQLVPKEPTREMLVVDIETDVFIGIDDARKLYCAMLSAAPTPPAQPEARSNEWTLIAPDGARFTGPTPGKTAIEASKHHMETDPEAREKFLRAIKQIAEEGRQEREQCMRDYGTLDCPHCGGSGHIADAVANGHVPQPEVVRVPLTNSERASWWSLAMNAAACLEDAAVCLRDSDAKKAAKGACEHIRQKCNRMWEEAAYGITASAPKQEPKD